jgi:hypothetical protein
MFTTATTTTEAHRAHISQQLISQFAMAGETGGGSVAGGLVQGVDVVAASDQYTVGVAYV